MKLLPVLLFATSLSATTLQPNADPFSGPQQPRDQRLLWESRICGFNTQLAYSGIPSNWTGCGWQRESKPLTSGLMPGTDYHVWAYEGVGPDPHPAQATPEPGAALLVAAGLMCVVVVRRTR